ncbi:MAG: LamG domain-containing protein [Kiritimatiellae bacterium]|nr:LamG domain-containing protein [Kiritimatiellia bacterium]MDD5522331.1 LamG domain-containing protein [Kiritimatiellia bacterium]
MSMDIFFCGRKLSCVILISCMVFSGGQAQEQELQPWQKPYSGVEATGESVLGLWQFSPGTETVDASGKGHDLKLRGTGIFNKDGHFGSCLETFASVNGDKATGAEVANSTGMTPAGAFTLEMWIKPKPEFEEYTKGVWLLDKMYVNYKHTSPNMEYMRDYALLLNQPVKGERTLLVYLGFKDDMVSYTSRPVRFAPDVWHHIAFTYDGTGDGRFFCDGESIGGGNYPGRKAVVPGTRSIVIGDRIGSSYGGFPGFISQVRICNRALKFYSGMIGLSASGRTSFIRMEKNGRAEWTVASNMGSPLVGATLVVDIAGVGVQRLPIHTVEAGTELKLNSIIDTRGRPGQYTMNGRIEGADGKVFASQVTVPLTIVPRPLPFRMPVVMWGGPDIRDEKVFRVVKHIGFTHSLNSPHVDQERIWNTGEPNEAESDASYKQLLDYALANDYGIAANPGPARWIGQTKKEFLRVDRSGKPYTDKHVEVNPCGLYPGAIDFCYNVGASIARNYGAYPGLQAALIHSEVRDSSQLCFHECDRAAFRAYAGFDIPDQVNSKHGVNYKGISDFPADHIIPDNYPLLTYYRWFWKQGDGWNQIHSAVHRGLKSTGRTDIWTWFDPAVRVPSVYGSGGEVDMVSQWTYSYPDPIRIGLATDELFTMAGGSKTPQKVMKMTQIIWYRTQTAPKPKPGEEGKAPKSSWQDTVPEADFLTIAPDHLRVAFWSMISRPVRGIMYHGWQSLVDTGAKKGYCFTHPETQEVLAQLTRDVVKPLGPTLLQVPDRKSDIGYLESFASQMFAGKGSWGWSGDDMYLVMQYAQLQPRILYEETVVERGLDGLKVLVMPDCDVLPRSVAEKVKKFQQSGGLVIADEFLTPAIVPDIRLAKYKRVGKADVDKAAIQAKAAELRKELDPFYRRASDSSNIDVITRVRRYDTTDYLFAVNDLRQYGNYVGQWRLVMEKGLSTSSLLLLDRPGGYIYDLTIGKNVPAVVKDGKLQIERHFGPGDGTVFMITERAISEIKLKIPRKVKLGKSAGIRITVVDKDNKPIDAVIPVQLDVCDAGGKPAEFSGFYGAKDGRVDVTLDLAANDSPGEWRIKVRELASGKTAEQTLNVMK